MSANRPLRRFVPRAFRYVLRPQDRNVMRFSLEHTEGQGGIEQTILLNLSESGVAFLVSRSADFRMNERMKIEVPIPGGDQIAWWGTVVRLQRYEPTEWYFGKDPFREDPKMMVAVRFDELPEPHSRAIRKGIEKSFMQAMREQHYRNWLYYRTLALQNLGMAFVILFAAILTAAFIWYFTLPSANYDAHHGAPWGDRYKF